MVAYHNICRQSADLSCRQVKLLVPADETGDVKAADNLSAAVKTIIVADAAMGVDNVLAVAGASHGSFLLVVLGFLTGVSPSLPVEVPSLAASADRYPVVLYAGSALLGCGRPAL